MSAAIISVLKELRGKRSQAAFAEACGLDPSHISLLERGRRHPQLWVAFCLARGAGISASELVHRIEMKTPGGDPPGV